MAEEDDVAVEPEPEAVVLEDLEEAEEADTLPVVVVFPKRLVAA